MKTIHGVADAVDATPIRPKINIAAAA